jgi:hypothetical protein
MDCPAPEHSSMSIHGLTVAVRCRSSRQAVDIDLEHTPR